jgi:hypothetical protein
MDDAVGIEDAHKVDVLEIKPFDDHLRPYEDIDPLLLELLDQRVMGCLSSYTVDVHAGNAGLGEDFFEMFLNPFGTEIALDKTMVAAGGTGLDGRVYGTAIMTVQFVGQLMKIQ